MKRINLILFIVLALGVVACSPAGDPAPEETAAPEPTAARSVEVATETPPPSPTPAAATETPSITAVKITPPPTNVPDAPAVAEETAASEAAVGESAVIVFKRNGGFAGVDETWTIFSDGTVKGPGGELRTVDPAQVQAVLDIAQTADFMNLADSYLTLDNCCDRFFYSVTIRRGEEVKTVNTVDDAPNQPDSLLQVMNAIGELLFGEG
ncbi:MAG: hypothetical protein ACE5E7_12970 [Anaerolineae bacterium]